MKRITVRAFVKVISCRGITTEHIESVGGTATRTEFKMVEDAPVVIEVHESESVERIHYGRNVSDKEITTKVCSAVAPKLLLSAEESQCENDIVANHENSLLRNNFLSEEMEPSAAMINSTSISCGKIQGGQAGLRISKCEKPSEKPVESTDINEFPVMQVSSDAEKKTADAAHDLQLEKAARSNSNVCIMEEKDFSKSNSITNLLMKGQRVTRKGCATRKKTTCNKICRTCGVSFTTRKELITHTRKKTCRQINKEDTSSFIPCDLCHAKFKSESLLRLHKSKVHCSPEENNTCSLCGRKFNSLSGFAKHKNLGTCSKSYTCNVCGKVYESKARNTFKKHLNSHKLQAEGKQFTCDDCGRSYMSQDALKKHSYTHLGIKPHSCQVCGKSFAMSYMVRDHMRTHTGIRSYLCNICGSSFSVSSHLARHLRSHSRGTLNKRGRPRKNSPEQDFQENQVTIGRMDNTVHDQCAIETSQSNGQNKELSVEQSTTEYQTRQSSLGAEQSQRSPNYSDRSLTPYANTIPHPDQQPGTKNLHHPDSLYETSFSRHYQEYHVEANIADYHLHTSNYASSQLRPSITGIPAQTADVSSNRNWPTDLCQYTSEISEPTPPCKSSELSVQASHAYHMLHPSENHPSLHSNHQNPVDSTHNMEKVTLHIFPPDPTMMQGNVAVHGESFRERDENHQENCVERRFLCSLDQDGGSFS